MNSKPTTTSYGAPIHYDNSNNPVTKGITVAAGPALQQQNETRARIYNDAARQWNASAIQPSLGNFFNKVAPMGFSMEPPDVKRPATFSGGDYHLGWNPGSLLGLASPVPGGGILTGALGQAAYTAMGGPNAILGGQGKMGMQNFNTPPSVGGSMASQAPAMAGIRPEGNGLNLSALLQAQQQRPRLGQMMAG